jgi:Binding-protein-dependent transport system inner membrane component
MVVAILRRIGITLLVLACVCGLYSGYRWLWMETGWTWPFVVDDITMPSLSSIVDRLFESNQPGGPLLIQVLLEAAWFTAKEAAAGFLLGAVIGLAGGTVLHLSLVLRRGLLPFVVASQTVPILAIAPMVVIWLGGKGLPIWVPVAVIAAYLTFFPVTINTLRGLDSAQPRGAGRACGRSSTRRRCRSSSPPSRSPPRRASSARSSGSCPRASRTGSAGRSSTSTSTTRSTRRRCGPRTSSPPRSESPSSEWS